MEAQRSDKILVLGGLAHILIALIKFYQRYLSGILGGRCRFVPSCSDYAYLAIQKHGAFKGSWLALRRILRCHRLSSATNWIDLVP